jgi:hypothetical protein
MNAKPQNVQYEPMGRRSFLGYTAMAAGLALTDRLYARNTNPPRGPGSNNGNGNPNPGEGPRNPHGPPEPPYAQRLGTPPRGPGNNNGNGNPNPGEGPRNPHGPPIPPYENIESVALQNGQYVATLDDGSEVSIGSRLPREVYNELVKQGKMQTPRRGVIQSLLDCLR